MEKNIRVKNCKRVDTRDTSGVSNGWILELVSDQDGFTEHIKGQMYLSVAAPGLFKGYHIHAAADYYVTCIKGKIKDVIIPKRGEKHEEELGDGNFKLVHIPKGIPHGFQNIGTEDAYILVYRYPSWSPELKEQLDIAPEDIDKEESWTKIKEFCKKFQ